MLLARKRVTGLRGGLKAWLFGMSLDVLLQILGALEGLLAKVALVRLQRNVHADMRRDVVSLDGSRAASAPRAGQVEIVGRLSPDMAFADMVLGKC